jgi:beta-phosphoglucomutase-like phosphatase (HAD superfamily)
VDRPKPLPDVYLRAAALLHVNPGNCIVFEDSPAGIEVGRAAGMRVVGVQTHSADLRGVDLSIRDFEDPKLEAWLISLQTRTLV